MRRGPRETRVADDKRSIVLLLRPEHVLHRDRMGFGRVAADLENGGLGDGLNNLAEWALGGDPTLSDAASVLQSEVDGGVLSLIYKRHLYADELGLDYTVGRDTELVATPEGWTTNGITEASGGIDLDFEAVTNTVPADIEGRFLRLLIEATE